MYAPYLPSRDYVTLYLWQVQLSTTHTVSLGLPPTISAENATQSASKVLALIETEEGKYQTSLNEAYQSMGEKTFKGLRRALPMTRAKLDWDKVCLSWNKGASCTNISAGSGIQAWR